MATRALNPKEEKIRATFAKCGLEEVDIQNCTMAAQQSIFMIDGAVVYRIKNSDNYLVFGNPINYSHILEKLKESANDPEKLKELFKDKLSLGEENGAEKVIDGEQEEECCGEECHDCECDHATNNNEAASEVNFNEEDLSLIMKEGKISKEEAVKLLAESEGDVIQALVNLNKK